MESIRPRSADQGWKFVLALWVSWVCVAAPASAAQFKIRPYLFSIRGEAIALAWQYAGGTGESSEVRIYKAGIETTRVPALRDSGLYYAILPIPDCGFGRDVSYRVPGMSAPVDIEEIPCAGETARFTFIADSQQGPKHVAKLVDDILAFAGSAILHGGDFVQTGGDLKAWLEYFGVMAPVGATRVTFPIVGNHEYRKNGEKLWERFFRFGFREGHYSFNIGDVEVFVLNSCFEDDSGLLDTQINWLDGALGRSNAQWKIVAFHHAPFSHSIGHRKWFGLTKTEHLVLQNYILPHVEYHRVPLVLSAHVHLYERFFKNGTHYINAGPAGGRMGIPLRDAENAVVLKRARTITHIEAGDRINVTTVGLNGDTLDRLTILPEGAPSR